MEDHFNMDSHGMLRRILIPAAREWNAFRNVYHASHLLRAPLAISNLYPYRPLDPSQNEIRLLRKSVASQSDEQISYTLDHVALIEKPQYEALSYTWGDDSGVADLNTSIVVDGHTVRVTKNLKAALSQLFADDGEQTLWADALCINQTDVSERNEQVGNMKTVYEEATCVISWLGTEYDDSPNAFKLLRSFHQNGIKQTVFDGKSEARKPSDVPSESVVKDVHALIRLFNRPYWQRAWVVQEVSLAKRVAFHCGSDSISWEEVSQIKELLTAETVFLAEAFFSTAVGHLVWHILSSGPNQVVRKATVGEEELTMLHRALVRHRLKRATDPRDKIYSLLGLVVPEVQSKIPVDYSLEPYIVFQNVANYVVLEEKDLTILTENKPPSNHEVLPSWVPNWTNANIADQIRIDRYNYPIRTFNASGPTVTAEAQLLPHHVLRVTGVHLGTVTATGMPMPDFINEDFRFEPVFDALYDWWLLFRSTGRRDIIGHDSLVHIVNYGMFDKALLQLSSERVKELEKSTLSGIKFALLTYRPEDETLLPSLGDLEAPTTESEKRRAEVDIWNIAPQCRKRKFIVVDEKGCGIGPQGVEVGDQLVVIKGCYVPIVLRERKGQEQNGNVNGGYLNVGDAFFENYMDGKAFDDIEKGIRRCESFDLH